MKDAIRIFHCFQQGIQTVVLIGDDRIHLLLRKNIFVAGLTSENENRHNFSFTDCLIDRLSRASLRSFDELHSASSSLTHRCPREIYRRGRRWCEAAPEDYTAKDGDDAFD